MIYRYKPLWIGLFAVLLCAGHTLAWEPARGPLATRWAKEVSPERVWSEYPRPQMVREDWVNLNGLWSYAIRPGSEDQPADVGRRNPRAVSQSSRR